MTPREKLLALTKRRYFDFDVPGLGPWRVQNLTESERTAYETAVVSYDKKGNLRNDAWQRGKRLLVQMTSVDADGKLALEPSDVDALEAVDGAALNVICDVAREHCGFTKTDMASLVGPVPLSA